MGTGVPRGKNKEDPYEKATERREEAVCCL
ncbi:uncharacterized protein METZ01_LOCUS468798 [marine metagenome]|uniref:Uncharacterized protein n=1 Tax=marine metagenome TaxID=408172 RepID=A0A383B7U2_9ZZZZ